MTTNHNGGTNASARATLEEWWAGDHLEPLVLPIADAPCMCEGLPRNKREWLTVLRCLLMFVANHLPSSSLKIWFARLAGMRIGKGCYIAPYTLLDPLYPHLIELQDGALLGLGCHLLTHEYSAREFRLGRVRIGRGAVIGAFATLRSGVSVGDGATVGMHSLVTKDVAAGDTVGGVPARSLRQQG